MLTNQKSEETSPQVNRESDASTAFSLGDTTKTE